MSALPKYITLKIVVANTGESIYVANTHNVLQLLALTRAALTHQLLMKLIKACQNQAKSRFVKTNI